MRVAHRVKNGCNQWNSLPEGYVNLQSDDQVQKGDVIRIRDDYYTEYHQGVLIGVLCGCPNMWFRKGASHDVASRK